MKEDAAKRVLDWLQDTEEFVVDQAPQLAEEVLWYGIAESAFVAVAMLVVISVFSYGSYLIYKHEESPKVFFTVPIIFNFLFLGVIVDKVLTILQIWFAPRLYLIEYFQNLIEGSGG